MEINQPNPFYCLSLQCFHFINPPLGRLGETMTQSFKKTILMISSLNRWMINYERSLFCIDSRSRKAAEIKKSQTFKSRATHCLSAASTPRHPLCVRLPRRGPPLWCDLNERQPLQYTGMVVMLLTLACITLLHYQTTENQCEQSTQGFNCNYQLYIHSYFPI